MKALSGFSLFALLVLINLSACSEATQPEAPKQVANPAPEPSAVSAPAPDHEVLIGELKEIAEDGSQIVVHTTKGVSETIQVKSETTFHNLKDDTKKLGHALKESGEKIFELGETGTHVVVHYSKETGKKTAEIVKHHTKDAVKASEGVIEEIDAGARTVAVKTKDGATEVYDVAEDTTVKVGDKLVDFGKWAADESKKAGNAIFHFGEKNGKKVAHAIEHAGE